MLQLIQIMHYMINHLEYTEDEIEQHFEAIESGALSLETALCTLNLEPYHPKIMEMIKEKLPKWRSALAVTKMRHGD